MKHVIALSIALTAALVGSYLTWTDDSEEVDGSRAAVYSASASELEQIAWKTETRDVTINKRSDARGEYFWIDTVERVIPKAPEPEPVPEDDEEGEPEPGAEEPSEKPPVLDLPEEPPADEVPAEDLPLPEITETRVSFLGSDDAEGLWNAYAPLMALRELPTASSVSDETLGLTEPTGTIEVTRRGQALVMTIGGETYGSKDRYVRYDSRIYLVDDGDLRPLQYASTRLVERSLYPQKEPAIESITVRYEGVTDTFLQENRDDKTKAYWARSARPTEQDDTAETWINKLLKLKLRSYLTEEDTGSMEPVFSFDVVGGETWTVDVYRSTVDPKVFYAKGAYNRSLVELTGSIAKNIIDDLPEVMAAE